MNKPLIGVLPLVDYEKDSYWMLPGYMEGIQSVGGLPFMLPMTADREDIHRIIDRFDGFLFTGGQDVSPGVYGETAVPECGETSPERDVMELELLKAAIDADKPILGICRGIQFINAARGGTVYQDLPSQRPSRLEHHQSPPYHIPVHTVNICQNTPLYSLLGIETLAVNSYHHQAVKTVSPALRTMAEASDGLTEAVFMPDRRFVWAVQWHPEFSFKTDDSSRLIFEAFVKASF